jgi:integrase
LLLLFETGARIGSLASVRPRDVVGCPPRRVRFPVAKNDRPYGVPLTPAASEALAALLGMMAPDQATVLGVAKTTLGQWFHEAASTAGFPPGRVHAHLARHTAGTMLYRRTHDPMLVKVFLNHADLSQVQRYVKVADEAMDEATAKSLTV